MTTGILALQGDFREHSEMLASIGQASVEVRRPEQLDSLDSLIIPGGESTTIARLILRYGFTEPLQAFCTSGRPLWGTCAGAILLARQVDELDRPGIETMDMTVARNAFGRQVDSFEASLEVKGLEGGPFRAIFIRAPIIESVGPGVEVLGRIEDGAIVAARQGNLLATAFHPELGGDTRLHQYFLTIGAAQRPRAGAGA
ncbi:MAG: pyridoxal 5'-phosphate synthase glutaminase subunit PdxT [Dehalococcoidia bacterium]|nr:pyridoxal 5'-phosphate synthase glutaminase subunit PdxT [Dehalococcoidia bacterium]MYI85672.1 pyridoxal 5'-phosphate synthase glutaminase subunit PdxT [Dehalococcoidia bacterium]